MAYDFPDAETLGKWHALLMEVLVSARALAWSEASHSQIAELGVNKKKTGRLLEGRTWDEVPGEGERRSSG
jgi:hypothetical protein